MNDDQNAYTDFIEALTGTSTRNLMCPYCGFLYHKTVRNVDRPYVIIVWQCPCGRTNHTKFATDRPKVTKFMEEFSKGD